MKSPTGTQNSNAWMTRIGWVLTGLSSANIILDSFGKFSPPALLLEEFHRLGESESLGAILLTGFLGGAEALQTRVSGSGAFLIMLPLLLGLLAWGGIWLRDERLRNLIPLRAPLF